MKELQAKRILFYVPESNVETNGVYASQVLGLARFLVKHQSAQVLIVQYAPQSPTADVELRELEPSITLLNDTRKRGYVSLFTQARFYCALADRVRSAIEAFRPTHVYCRQYQTVDAARRIADWTGARVVYSMRGEDVTERRLGGGIKDLLVSWWIKGAVTRALKLPDHVNTVSLTFAKWIQGTYGVASSVLPCCVDEVFFKAIEPELRQRLRAELGLGAEDKVIVFSGSLFGWQCIEETIALMKRLCVMDARIRALFLVKDVETLEQLCAKAGFERGLWRARSCKPTEVPQYLQLCDAGVMLRKDLLLNRVASPVKVAEYLASGLRLIASECAGDLFTRAEGCAFLMGEGEVQRMADVARFIVEAQHGDAVSQAAKHFAQAQYTWQGQKNLEAIQEMFGE